MIGVEGRSVPNAMSIAAKKQERQNEKNVGIETIAKSKVIIPILSKKYVNKSSLSEREKIDFIMCEERTLEDLKYLLISDGRKATRPCRLFY